MATFAHIIIYLFILSTSLCDDSDDYYKLLGVDKTADIRDIRRAFKNLAVQKHPDKNIDDPNAQENFVKLAEAYEVLKDPEKRRQYDLYGKQGTDTHSSPRYHSYSYYRDQFGIYDDDPLIATLTKDDLMNSIGESIWFINFYSPLCSHCHHLAPEWRELSKLLEGVVKIGAVNCGDEKRLCWDIPIQQFPTLLFFDEKSSVYNGQEYNGPRNAKQMEKFIISYLQKTFTIRQIFNSDEIKNDPWVLFLCFNQDCLDNSMMIKLASAMKGIVNVGFTNSKLLINQLGFADSTSETEIIYLKKDNNLFKSKIFNNYDLNILTKDLLELLPAVPKYNQKDFQNARTQLRENSDIPWLFCFTLPSDNFSNITLKKLSGLLPSFNIGEINCAENSGLCQSLHIVKYPTWGILKNGGAFEKHSGKDILHAIERFALDAQEATNIHALSPQDVENIMGEGSPWLIGWLLTGCPPCKKLLPILRKASSHFTPNVIQFGTVDCAVHTSTCHKYNANSYPTVSLYNHSSTFNYQGASEENAIVDFIQNILDNLIIPLTITNFDEELTPKKNSPDVYLVEFYVSWCAPCRNLQPEWLNLAKKLKDVKNIKIGAVNCEQQYSLCNQESINGYPTIKLYPVNLKNNKIMYYSGARDYGSILGWLFSNLPSSVKELNEYNFKKTITSKREDHTWVVLFFAPWCGFCHQFEPDFIIATYKLRKIVVAGKVNCQREGALCHSENIQSYPSVKLYQRVDGVTTQTKGIFLNALTQNELYNEIRTYAANAYITPVDHDEL